MNINIYIYVYKYNHRHAIADIYIYIGYCVYNIYIYSLDPEMEPFLYVFLHSTNWIQCSRAPNQNQAPKP